MEIGAARTRRTPKRADWRLAREIFVADTDAEAVRLSAGGMIRRMMRQHFRRSSRSSSSSISRGTRPAGPTPTSRLSTVQAQLAGGLADRGGGAAARIYEDVGGFGTLLLFCFDYVDNPGA